MQSLTWEQIISGDYVSTTGDYERGTRVVITDEILDKLIQEGYKGKHGKRIVKGDRHLTTTGTKYICILKDMHKTCIPGFINIAEQDGLTIYQYNPSGAALSPSHQPSEKMSPCPLCGSDGHDLIFSFYCSKQGCDNYRD